MVGEYWLKPNNDVISLILRCVFQTGVVLVGVKYLFLKIFFFHFPLLLVLKNPRGSWGGGGGEGRFSGNTLLFHFKTVFTFLRLRIAQDLETFYASQSF